MKKKLLIIIVTVVVVALLGFCIYEKVFVNDKTGNKLSSTEGITTALTLEDEIKDDTIWCGTFQLIWNDLKNDLAKQDIVFIPQLKVVENLNLH